jgi:tripartite-type tricarboxylate transporter receptor subunit TctC
MAGRVQYAWVPLVSSVGALKDGRIMALAVSTRARSNVLPNVPTIAEAGFPGGQFDFWVGMLAPARTPRDVVARLNAEVNKAEQLPEVRERLAKLGAEPMPMSPQQFDAYIQEEANVLQKVMRAAGAKAS